ncbi:MAG TPA: hypothetical protein VFA44_12945 [Gaiellaceae bacterium]|nr:hypothetical protein [Gaiellaceae bacterium]
MLAAVAAAVALACHPAPGLGTLAYPSHGVVHVVDLSTCRTQTTHAVWPAGPRPVLESPDGRYRVSAHLHTLVVTNVRTHLSADVFHADSPVIVAGWSPDSRWILFAVDPMGSASLAADGLELQAVTADGRRTVAIAPTLMYADYRAWCGRDLVLTTGGNRLATAGKSLTLVRPGTWSLRPLVRERLAWGSVVCASDGRSVVVQAQPPTDPLNLTFNRANWALWRVGFDGTSRKLTSPPHGYSDDSPLVVGRTIFFVRSHRGAGLVYALRDGRVLGPFARLGPDSGFYGHHTWPYSVTP